MVVIDRLPTSFLSQSHTKERRGEKQGGFDNLLKTQGETPQWTTWEEGSINEWETLDDTNSWEANTPKVEVHPMLVNEVSTQDNEKSILPWMMWHKSTKG